MATDVSVVVDGTALLAPTTFAVHSGGVVALRGANGSGKTTLLRVLAGALRPTGGRASLDRSSPSERDPLLRRRVAAMIGFPPLARNLTVREHVGLVRASWGIHSVDGRSDAELLHGLGLGGLDSRFPHELSSGQTQLFALALTLARPSELLLLDEPEQRLDPRGVDAVAGILLERARAGAAIVMSTHSDVLTEATGAQVVSLAKALDGSE